jgi:hypothetical protein
VEVVQLKQATFREIYEIGRLGSVGALNNFAAMAFKFSEEFSRTVVGPTYRSSLESAYRAAMNSRLNSSPLTFRCTTFSNEPEKGR